MDIRNPDSNNEKLYSPSQWCNGRCDSKNVVSEHIKISEKESQKVKSKYSCKADLKYGSKPRQVLDIFEPNDRTCAFNYNGTPTFVYIHGGYWQEQLVNKETSCYCVAPLLNAGIRVVIVDYDLAPDVPLKLIMKEIEELVQYLLEKGNTEKWGSLWVGGHSAGAHLASSMLCSKICEHISGLILISGIYDLRPLISTSVNTNLSLTEDEAVNSSPLLLISQQTISNFSGPIIMVVGEYESPAFHQQQIHFSQELIKKGLRVEPRVIPQVDHFTIVEQLCSHDYFLTKVIIKTILY